MFDNRKAYAQLSPWNRTVEFLLVEERGEVVSVGEPVVMTVHKSDFAVERQPTFRLSMDAAQFLMDQLWNCGLRPSEGTGSAGALAATQSHLRDVQTVMTKLLDKVLTTP